MNSPIGDEEIPPDTYETPSDLDETPSDPGEIPSSNHTDQSHRSSPTEHLSHLDASSVEQAHSIFYILQQYSTLTS